MKVMGEKTQYMQQFLSKLYNIKSTRCVSGYVNDILSAPILYPFSRVTYCAYLVHPIIIRLTAMNMDSPLHLGKDSIVS